MFPILNTSINNGLYTLQLTIFIVSLAASYVLADTIHSLKYRFK